MQFPTFTVRVHSTDPKYITGFSDALALAQSESHAPLIMCPAPWTDSPPPLLMEEDYSSAPRPHPLSHPPVDAPLCVSCTNLDLSFFDPSCPGCHAIIKSRETRQGHRYGTREIRD